MTIERTKNLIMRPPVVVVLGHIDHGKTSLLQAIRKIQFTGEKPGGVITQHIGAYQIERSGPSAGSGQAKKITFIDTPGHEAFSAMRSRGAKVADIAILVIDATEGVKDQTKEAISHIKEAQIPFIVALNKIDKPEANPEKVKRELQKEEVLVESLGGKVPSVGTSAKTGKGVEELLELILLVAEMEGLKADLTKRGEGVVIESFLDSQRGPTATLILTQGVLKTGDILGTLSTFGKVKSLENFRGLSIEKALPSEPVIVIGFEDVPKVGENFEVFSDLASAKAHLKKSEQPSARAGPRTRAKLGSGLSRTELRSSSGLSAELAPHRNEVSGAGKVLNLILKTDVLGSIEAIEEVLRTLPQEKVVLRILKSGVGQINESDIKFAKAHPALSYPAVILGFRVKSDPVVQRFAEREKVKIMTFEVIYELVEEIRKFMEEILEPEAVRIELGKAKISAIFLVEKNRQIIGGKVIEGEVKKGTKIEVSRNEKLVGRGKLINLQREKKDVDKVMKSQDCGILFEGDIKIEEGDILAVYTEEKRKTEI